jgi:hypothetical protein
VKNFREFYINILNLNILENGRNRT